MVTCSNVVREILRYPPGLGNKAYLVRLLKSLFHRVFIFQLTETVASQFERCDEPPYFRPLKTSSTSRDSVSEVPSVEGTGVLNQKGTVKQNSVSKEDVKIEEGSRKDSKDERKESREERRDAKDDRKEKGDSLPRGMEGSGIMYQTYLLACGGILRCRLAVDTFSAKSRTHERRSRVTTKS